MPTVKLTQEIINRGKQPDAGWHLCELENFNESEASKKDSKNWVYSARILRSANGIQDNEGRYCTPRFNSKAPGFLLPFFNAVLDTNISEECEIEFTSVLGKEVWCKVEDGAWDGKRQKNVTEYASAAKPPF